MEIKTIVTLTSEEKHALFVLSSIKCHNVINCTYCPFKNKKNLSCLLSAIQRNSIIVMKQYNEGEIKNEN